MTNFHYNTGSKIESTDDVSTILQKADLNWDVKVSGVRYGEFCEYESESIRVAYRSDIGQAIDSYGSRRKPLQNREMITMFDKFLKSANLSISNAGSMSGGSRVWASSDLPVEYDINVRKLGDITKARLLLVDSHMSGEGMQVFVHYDSLWCTNGCTSKVKAKVGVIHHSGTISESSVMDVLNFAARSIKLKGEFYDRLAEKAIDHETALAHLINAFGDPEETFEKQPEIVKTAYSLFLGEGIAMGELTRYNTAYGLLSAITEFYSHKTRTRNNSNLFANIVNGDYATGTRNFERQLQAVYCR